MHSSGRKILLLSISLVCVLAAIYVTTPKITNIYVKLPTGSTYRSGNLYLNDVSFEGTYQMRASMNLHPFSQRVFSITPDDCLSDLKVNGKRVPFISPKLCLSDKEKTLNLSQYVHVGTNTLEFKIENNGGAYGLYIRNSLSDPMFAIYAFLFLINIGFLIAELMKIIKVPKSSVAILIGGLFLRFWYMSYTVFITRNHDVWHHIEYILKIIQLKGLPDADLCYECHQKPLYYLISAILTAFSQILNIQDYFTLLQITNILLFFVLTVFCYLLFKEIWKKNTKLINIGLLLICFWPSGVIHSVRITNEIAFYAGYAVFLYFLYRYLFDTHEKSSRWNIILAGVALFVTVFVKINAIAGLPLALGTYILKQRSTGVRMKRLVTILFLFIAITGLAIIPYFFQNNNRSLFSRITKSDQIGDNLRTGNTLSNYLYFDEHAFLTNSYISPWEDATGRQYVWNYFIKSSLFGEFQFNTALHKPLAIVITYALFILLMYMFSGVIYASRHDVKQLSFFILNALFLVCMFLYYRYNFPASCNTDFRYIFPVLVSFIYFFVFSIQKYKEKKFHPMEYLGYSIAILFAILVVVFFSLYPMMV